MADKDMTLAFQQLAKALLTRPGKIYAECASECEPYCGLKWGVVEGANILHYEYEFSQPEAEIIAALMNWNDALEWDDIAAIVALFEPETGEAE